MTKSQLTKRQQSFLDFFSGQERLWKRFYFSGGTALSEFYLHHRFSEDLDFFSEDEFDANDLNLFLQSKKNDFEGETIQFQQSFNRNMFFIRDKSKQELKVEFTYYPFPRLKEGLTKDNLQIDSVWDIGVNKVFTLMQKPRGRDYVDIFFIAQKYHFDFNELVRAARGKFDYPINYLQLGKNLIKVNEFLDDSILTQPLDREAMAEYFFSLAKQLELIKK
jgi:predicted nucleotidyltransferase component of viral defense system